MKKYLLLALITMISLTALFSETIKFAYIDTEKIMSSCKDTQEAQKLFVTDRDNWKKQVDDMDVEIQRLQSEFDSRKLTLTEAGKKDAQTKIEAKKTERQQFVESVFGENGRAMQRNQELLEPIMKKLKKVIEKIAVEDNYLMILDSNNSGLLYAKPSLDITDRVVLEMNKNE